MKARLLAVAGSIAALLGLSGCGPSEPKVEGRPADARRLTEVQYRNIIADVFGSNITVSGRFDPLVRTDGLLAAGTWDASVTPAGFVQFEDMARTIAAQVVSPANRAIFVPCAPEASKFDEACAREFLGKSGRLLFRRPLSTQELDGKVAIAKAAMDSLGGFYESLAFGLSDLLVAPDFLFVMDAIEPDPSKPGAVRLTPYAKASRLSFLLWNTAPDEALLAAAEKGELSTREGLSKQVDRMIASPRLKTGVRAFFSDMLSFQGFDVLEKDSIIYPAFNMAAVQDSQEQTLRTIVDHLVTREGDYRELFTTRQTFMSRALGRLYKVQVQAPDGAWEPYELPEGSPRVGIQGQLAFLALNSHPGRSSPTLRGKAIRTMLMCQKIPDPPGDVDFSQFSDPNSPNKTARERLTVHQINPTCAGCHRIMDPIGLALENFDGAGQYRTTESDVVIDASGDLDGVPFTDPPGLAKALHDSPATTSCVVNRLYTYATGKPPGTVDPWFTYLRDQFTSDGFKMKTLLRRVAASDAFYAVSPPAAAPVQSAHNGG